MKTTSTRDPFPNLFHATGVPTAEVRGTSNSNRQGISQSNNSYSPSYSPHFGTNYGGGGPNEAESGYVGDKKKNITNSNKEKRNNTVKALSTPFGTLFGNNL